MVLTTKNGNWVFDVCGSYKPVLLAGGGITLAVTVVFQFVITVSERQLYKDFIEN